MKEEYKIDHRCRFLHHRSTQIAEKAQMVQPDSEGKTPPKNEHDS
jgi:hypothetical protein